MIKSMLYFLFIRCGHVLADINKSFYHNDVVAETDILLWLPCLCLSIFINTHWCLFHLNHVQVSMSGIIITGLSNYNEILILNLNHDCEINVEG